MNTPAPPEPEPCINVNLVLVDETRYWVDLPADVAKVCTKYLYEPDKVVHCCELKPSYALHAVDFYAENHNGGPVSYESDEWLRHSWGYAIQDVDYMHCDRVDSLNPTPVTDHAGNLAEYEDMDEAIEDERANPMIT